MESLYVIVHKHLLYQPDDLVSEEKRAQVLREIKRIEREENHLYQDADPGKLPKGLPRPHPDLLVLVAGLYQEWCVDIQYGVLRSAGYQTAIHQEGTFE